MTEEEKQRWLAVRASSACSSSSSSSFFCAPMRVPSLHPRLRVPRRSASAAWPRCTALSSASPCPACPAPPPAQLHPKGAPAKPPKKKWRFLQKYWHRGAFFQASDGHPGLFPLRHWAMAGGGGSLPPVAPALPSPLLLCMTDDPNYRPAIYFCRAETRRMRRCARSRRSSTVTTGAVRGCPACPREAVQQAAAVSPVLFPQEHPHVALSTLRCSRAVAPPSSLRLRLQRPHGRG